MFPTCPIEQVGNYSNCSLVSSNVRGIYSNLKLLVHRLNARKKSNAGVQLQCAIQRALAQALLKSNLLFTIKKCKNEYIFYCYY